MTTPITTLPITGYTITDLALVAPAAGQFLEVGGASDGRIDIDALAAYCRAGTTWGSITGKPTSLLGYGITDAQPLDANLTELAALTTTAYGRGFLPLVDGPAALTYIGAAATSHTQAWSTITSIPANLTTVSGWTADQTTRAGAIPSATSGGIKKTAANTFSTFTLTAAAESLLDDTTHAAMRTTLELGTAATAATGTTEGTIPVLGVGGRLDAARLPASITISLTLRSGFVARGENENRLTIFPDGFAELHFGVTNATVPATTSTILDWTGYPALKEVTCPDYTNDGDTYRAYIFSGTSALRFQRLSGSASTVLLIGQIRFRWA